jgi:thiol-disulfide isomerase/thioredoxin
MYFCNRTRMKTLRNRFLIVCAGLSLCSIGQALGISISGKLSNAPKTGKIYLYRYFGNELDKIDSVKTAEGAFSFKTKDNISGMLRIGYDIENSFDVIVSNENVQIEADLAQKPITPNYKNSSENTLLATYQKHNNEFLLAYQNLDKEYAAVAQNKNQEESKVLAEFFGRKLDSIYKGLQSNYAKIAISAPNTFMGKYLKSMMVTDTTNAGNYFSNSDFTDKDLVYSPLVPRKVETYLMRFTEPTIPSFQASADALLAKIGTANDAKLIAYKSLIDIFDKYQLEYAGPLSKKMVAEYPNSARVAKYVSIMPKRGVDVGDFAPDMVLVDTNGVKSTVSFKDFKGKVVLLDFWASWCGPCRKENPNVVKAYQEYKSKGFTIVSISLDENVGAWKKAILKDGLIWKSHFSDLKGWSSTAAKTYKVNSIPNTFLIGPDGKIVAKNLRGPELEQALQQMLVK